MPQWGSSEPHRFKTNEDLARYLCDQAEFFESLAATYRSRAQTLRSEHEQDTQPPVEQLVEQGAGPISRHEWT